MENEEQPVVEPLPPPENKRTWEPSQFQTAELIADRLGEKQADARTQIVRIVQALGRTQANALLAETLRIEEQGGLPVKSGARRRSPGGVFFHLAYTTGITKSGGPRDAQRDESKEAVSCKTASKALFVTELACW